MIKKLNIKMISMTLLYCVLLAPFFQTDIFNYRFTFMLNVFKYGRILSLGIILIMCLKKKTISSYLILIFLYLLSLFPATIMLKTSSLADLVIYMASILTLCLIIDYGIKYDLKHILRAFILILSVLCLTNTLSVILYPHGLYMNSTGYIANWVLGYKNTLILFLMPWVISSILYSLIYKNKLTLWSIFTIIITVVNIVLINSSTAIIGVGIIIIYLLFEKIINKFNVFNSWSYLGFYIASFFGLVIFRIQKLASLLIVNILHKELTFTGRIYIWDSVLKAIKYRPLLGYGNITYVYNRFISTTHNSLLDILYRSGIIGLILYLSVIIKAVVELYKYRSERISRFIAVTLLSYFIMMFMEAYSLNLYIYVIIFAINVGYFIKVNKKEELYEQ